MPKNKSKNILLIKKGFNSCKSTNYCGYYSNSINYLKIYKNKIYNIKLNPIKHTKLSEKHSTSKKKQNNTINQKILLFSKNKIKSIKEINKDNINYSKDKLLQRSSQNQIKQIKKYSKKKICLNLNSIFSNSKSNIKEKTNSHNKEPVKTPKNNKNSNIQLTSPKEMKQNINSSIPLNNIINKKIFKLNKPLKNSNGKRINKKNYPLNEKNYKQIEEIPKSNHIEKISTFNTENTNNRAITYISINNNEIPIYDTNKNKPEIQLIKHPVNDVNRSFMNKQKNYIIPNKNTELKKNKLIKINKKKELINSEKITDSLKKLFNINEKNSRNKFYNFMKNVSLINCFANKTANQNFSRINDTQQNKSHFSKFYKRKAKKI